MKKVKAVSPFGQILKNIRDASASRMFFIALFVYRFSVSFVSLLHSSPCFSREYKLHAEQFPPHPAQPPFLRRFLMLRTAKNTAAATAARIR